MVRVSVSDEEKTDSGIFYADKKMTPHEANGVDNAFQRRESRTASVRPCHGSFLSLLRQRRQASLKRFWILIPQSLRWTPMG